MSEKHLAGLRIAISRRAMHKVRMICAHKAHRRSCLLDHHAYLSHFKFGRSLTVHDIAGLGQNFHFIFKSVNGLTAVVIKVLSNQ